MSDPTLVFQRKADHLSILDSSARRVMRGRDDKVRQRASLNLRRTFEQLVHVRGQASF
jgi:hypothetical protein